MLNSLKGMVITLVSTLKGFKEPVTRQYPKTPTPVQPRYMGFPALTWDDKVPEPFCTGCMVCVRNCPTQCMKAVMHDNPKHATEESPRRKIIKEFEINLNRCILCGICVEVCNFDAIVMSHEHEKSDQERNAARTDLEGLLKMGRKFQAETGWRPPSEIEKEKKEAVAKAKAAAAPPPEPAAVGAESENRAQTG